MNEQTTDPLIGRLLDGRYQVTSRIARGGMATVYLATDLRLERRVAIKVMHGHLADDAQFTQRFIQEARSAARLAHPNVVNVFDQGQDHDMAYLVMEYLPGITLRDLLREHRSLTSEQTLDILEAVLSGLAAAHKAGIVHRDLKPENVLLADDGRIKIGDFGLARAASANTATGAALLGTIAYLSPELVTRGIADTRSDIYAVGIMMYEMLTGEQPFKGDQPMQIAYQHANDSVPSPSGKNPRVPAELDELVLWATAKDPDERPRDARALLDQLSETQAQLSTAIPTVALATAKTSVLPAPTMLLPREGTTDAATQVLGSRAAESGPVGTTATTDLTRTSNRRRTRGRWLIALVLVLAAIAGGTGWYFGAGPGGHVEVPTSLVGATQANATATLEDAGLHATDPVVTAYSSTVPKGSVISTDPSAAASVPKGSSVTLTVSKGPQRITVPAFANLSLDKAIALAQKSGLVYDASKNLQRFSSSVANSDIVRTFGVDRTSGKTITLSKGADYWAGSPVFFDYSIGAIPAVAGTSLADATAALKAVGLTATQGSQQFSDTVAKGDVIKATPASVVRPGDDVPLVISKGQDLVAVPGGVLGATIASAKSTLEAAGFSVTVQTNLPQPFWDAPGSAIQQMIGPDGTAIASGAQLKRGATITIVANY